MTNIYYDRKELLNEFIKENSSVLDIGANEGNLHQHIKGLTFHVDGWDIENNNDKSIKIIDLNKTFKCAKKYDVIVLGEIIEHLDNPYKVINQLKNNLKKDGIIIITTPNCRTLGYNWKYLNNHPQHIYAWDLKILNRFMDKIGFDCISKGYISSYRTKFIMQFIQDKSWHIYGVYVLK